MAHFAKLNDKNIVECVLVGRDEDDEDALSARTGHVYKRTSYNTVSGVHLLGGAPFRGNFAGIGYVYDPAMDAFYPPRPGEEYELDGNTYTWRLRAE